MRTPSPVPGADSPAAFTAFALPGRLAAKADPALTGGDDRHFAAVTAALEQSVAELTASLDAALRSPAAPGGPRWTGTPRCTASGRACGPCAGSASTSASATSSARTTPSRCTSAASASPTATAAAC